MFNNELYDLTQNLQGAIFQQAFPCYNESQLEPYTPPPIMQLRAGHAESPGWLMVQALEFAPEPLTVDRLRVRAIWSSPGIIRAILELLASEKWLDRRGQEYDLTDAGYAVIHQRMARMAAILDCFETPYDLTPLEQMLNTVVEASLQMEHHWSLKYSRRRAPQADAPTIHKIVHHLSDLNAFRDDAHMASWRQYNVDGYVWETFAHVHDSTANTAESLFDQLAYRGYSLSDFASALDELLQRGWVKFETECYLPTGEGRTIHAQSEKRTDDYFFTPWSEELEVMLIQFYNTLS